MVTNNFSKSGLDLNGLVTLTQPTSLDWGPDGRLYVTEVSGNVKVLTVAFGDPDPNDTLNVNSFYVTDAETLSFVKDIPNFNDDGSAASGNARQVTGISVVPQYDALGQPVTIFGKPAVSVYVTSSDSRIGGASDGDDTGLDTNSGVITRIDQTETGWTAVDLVRGLARSEENHALNGLEVIQQLDASGNLVSERLIVANGGNANNGAPSNNFAGQQETAYSAAILEVDLDQLKGMEVLTDSLTGRQYVYDVPTLDDPTRPGEPDTSDPFGGNDGLNGGKIDPDGPVQIYSAGYRNAYDVEVTEDGRVWTYDNGSNNSWGGRPIGEAGDDGAALDYAQWIGYIATNLNNGDGNSGDPINLESWDPKNYDQFHEITRSDDLAGRQLSAGPGGAATYEWLDPDSGETLTLVYGGHPNPTRASGGQSGLLFTPANGVADAYLMVSDVDKDGPGSSDYDAVIAWLSEVESRYATVAAGDLTGRVIGVTPGESYYITDAGKAYYTRDYPNGPATINGETVLGQSGLPADFAEVVASLNPIEGNYLEGGYTDGAVDAGKGSVNGLTEYTSTVLDDPENGIKMSGAILAASLNQSSLTVMGRDENGVMQTTTGTKGQTLALERSTIAVSGAPLGLASIGDDLTPFDGQTAFQGSVWTTVFKQNGPLIEILQPNNGAVPLAGSEIVDPTDQDGDGVDHLHDPFEFSDDNGFDLNVNERLVLDFGSETSGFSGTIFDTGLMGAALDGVTPNRDARTADEGFEPEKQEDGLYDLGGNIIPGGNAPIFQIKKVIGGTMTGSANTARDAMHVGIKPGPNVDRLVVSSKAQNWVSSVSGGLKPGQLTGIMLGDGTQANFLRLVFGAMMIDGVLAAGFEVGYEIDDVYTPLTRVAAPELSGSSVATLDLLLEVDIGNDFAVSAGYQLDNAATPVMLDLGGFALPPGVLQDVLTGAHTISDGDTTLPSGAAVGFIAETSPEDAATETGLSAIDFYDLRIEALGNEILADTAAEVGTQGTEGFDTIIYTGSDTDLAPLAANVENFDGSGSAADFSVTGNSGDNVMIAGAGLNTFTGGGGADSIRGTFEHIDGSLITDFLPDDDFLILDRYFTAEDVGYSLDAGVVKLTFTDPQTGETATINLESDQFAGFDPADGPSVFEIEQTEFGTRVSYDIKTVIYRVNTGGGTVAATDGGLPWLGDADSDYPFLFGNKSDTYSDELSDEKSEIDLTNLGEDGTVPWQVFVTERGDNDPDMPLIEYAFPVTAGETYAITLYYTENWPGIFNESDRIFDVEVEGSVPAEFSGINPLQEAVDLYGADAGQQALLGVGLSRTYTLTTQDDTLNLAFLHDVQNPKINAIEIKQFGFGVSAPDRTPPAVKLIWVEEPTDNDSPILATVVVKDETGIDVASIDGDELIFTGIEPSTVALAPGSDAIVLSADGKTATIKYQLMPPSDTGAWSSGDYTVGVAAGSYQDTSGNGVAAFETSFDIAPTSNTLLSLNFDQVGAPLVEGGFDGLLGGIQDASKATQLQGGDLVIATSDGDIAKGQSANDFIKYVDLSSDTLNEIVIGTRFDNPFPAALAAQGLPAGTIPNYAQQGIVFGLGTQGNNELVKLVLGGNKGNVIQIWSNPDLGGIDTTYALGDLLVDSSLGLDDVASLEMTLSVDKAAGTVTPIVTLFGAGGAVLGGLRASPTGGFVTATAEAVPEAVLANLLDPATSTAVGVTSNDYKTLGSYEARWEYLEVTTPDPLGEPLVLIAIANAPTVLESGNTGVTSLAFALTTEAGVDATLDIVYTTDAGATTQTQAVTFVDGAGTLTIDVANDDIDNGPDDVTVKLVNVTDEQYAVDPNANTATGSVAEDDQTTLIAISDAPTLAESGDSGTTSLSFDLATGASVNATLDIAYTTDAGVTTQTATVTFVDGVATLTIEVANDDIDNGTDTVTVALLSVSDANYAIDPNANTANGSVVEDDQAALIAISDAPTLAESGDSGVTTLFFDLATQAGVNADLELSYTTDGGATTQTATVTFVDGAATLAIDVPNDDIDDGTDSVLVELLGVSDTQYAIDPNGDSAVGSVTEDDQEIGALLALDFELPGDPLTEGGFDGVLGDVTDAGKLATIQDGELVLATSDGDIAKGNSANDFIRYLDLSDAALNELTIDTRFDNPFPAALAAQGLPAGTIPDYAQQGIVFGLGTQGNN
ncbi:Di-glucose binding within endoplasmic reticulum, partial [Modicisalibacter ilicicola DSM 19980]